MADVIPDIFLYDQAIKKSDFLNDDMRIAFLSGTYSDCALRETISFSELSGCEVSGSNGYTPGGLLVKGQSVTVDTNTNELIYNIDDIYMTVSGGTFGPTRYGAIYDLSNDDHLVYVFDFGEDKTVNDGAKFKIKIDDAGLMKAKQM